MPGAGAGAAEGAAWVSAGAAGKGKRREGDRDSDTSSPESTAAAAVWHAVPGISVSTFTDVVEPLLWGFEGNGVKRKVDYEVRSDEVAALKRSLAVAGGGLLESNYHKRNLTYGEVLPPSVWDDVLPRVQLRPDDVFYDLGSGTGKIVVQVALQSACRASKGIEVSTQRHREAEAALERLTAHARAEVDAAKGAAAGGAGAGAGRVASAPSSKALAALDQTARARLVSAADRVAFIEGDCCSPGFDMDDATVVFINNVCFEADLMARIVAKLAALPRLRRVVVLRKLCDRHRDGVCRGQPCMRFGLPEREEGKAGSVDVTWTAERTTVWTYSNIGPAIAQEAL